MLKHNYYFKKKVTEDIQKRNRCECENGVIQNITRKERAKKRKIFKFNNNHTQSVIPQVGSGEGRMYETLPLPFGITRISHVPQLSSYNAMREVKVPKSNNR